VNKVIDHQKNSSENGQEGINDDMENQQDCHSHQQRDDMLRLKGLVCLRLCLAYNGFAVSSVLVWTSYISLLTHLQMVISDC
jgi:hypothetical protein